MNSPSRLEIEKFAKERFQADLEHRADEYAKKQAQAIAQVMSRGNRAGYLLALIHCKQERLRAEILTLADAWVEAGTTYAVPLPVEAEEAFEKTAAEMAAGTLSALRGELDLMTERIGLVSVPTDGVREIGKAMKSAVGEGRLRLKTQRVKAGHMAMQRFFQNLTVRAEPLEAASSNSPAVQLVHFPSQLPEARLEVVGLAPGLIGKLSKEALTRMQAETTTFLEQYLPKLQRESNQNPIHDAELLKELVLHHYCLLGQECMAVCGSPDEFERQLWGEIAGSVRYALSKYPWLANGAMREELDSGFSFFIMRANPWADIAESDRRSTWHVGAITGEALSDLAMKLLTEARKRAAEGGFDKPGTTVARSTTPPNDGDKQEGTGNVQPALNPDVGPANAVRDNNASTNVATLDLKRPAGALFFSSSLVTIVRQAGTPQETRWDTQLGGDFVHYVLSRERLTTGDEIHCELFDEPRVITRVDPILLAQDVSHWKARIVPRTEWSRLYKPKHRPQAQGGRLGEFTSSKAPGSSLAEEMPYRPEDTNEETTADSGSTIPKIGQPTAGGATTPLALNVELIRTWINDEGWNNETLAVKLKISERAVSSMRNNGAYHGTDAVTKLANLMGRDPEDLYLPREAST